MYLQVNDQIQALLKRSTRRRTIGIKVQRGAVQINAPAQAPLEEIQAFVQQKSLWIQRHLRRQIDEKANRDPIRYQEGDTLFYMGESLRVRLIPAGYTEQIGEELRIVDRQNAHALRAMEVATWLTERAREYLPKRVEYWSRLMGLTPSSIKIRHYKSRWGSCDRRGGLQFNWLVMMAPQAIIDYIVVHELAHLVHFNHSNRFWNLVAEFIPDYLQRRHWLRRQTHMVWQLEP